MRVVKEVQVEKLRCRILGELVGVDVRYRILLGGNVGATLELGWC